MKTKTWVLAWSVAMAAGAFAADAKLYYRVAGRKTLVATAQRLSTELANPLVGTVLMEGVMGLPAGKLFAIDVSSDADGSPQAVTNAELLASHVLKTGDLARVWISPECLAAFKKAAAEQNPMDASLCGLDSLRDASAALVTSPAGLDFVFSGALDPNGELAKSTQPKLSVEQLAFKDVPDNAHVFSVQNDFGGTAVTKEQRDAIVKALFTDKEAVFKTLAKQVDDAQAKAVVAVAEKCLRRLVAEIPAENKGFRTCGYAATDAEGRFKYHCTGSGSAPCAAFVRAFNEEMDTFMRVVCATYSNELTCVSSKRTADSFTLSFDAAKLVKDVEPDPKEAKETLKLVKALFGGDKLAFASRVKGDSIDLVFAGSDFKDGKNTGRAAAKFAKCCPEAAARKDLSYAGFASLYTLSRNAFLGVLKRGFEPKTVAPYGPILNQLPNTGDAGIGAWLACSPTRVEGAFRISYGEIHGLGALGFAFMSYKMMSEMSGEDDEEGEEGGDDEK